MNNKFTEFNLDKNIIKALNNLNYKIPSNVQNQAIPKLLDRSDLIVKSKTGSGKTASFGIPICESVDINDQNVQALVIVPTRELALQVKEEISNIGRLKKVRCSAIFGKQSIKEQIHELKQRVHVVVATPGRIIDHIERGTINLSEIKYLIIDEADKMLNKGFIEQIDAILENTNEDKTTALFSATIDEDIKYICDKYMKSAINIDIEDNLNIDKKQIDENIARIGSDSKYSILKKLIYSQNPKSIIVFCNTKDEVKKLHNKMRKDKFSVCELHGDMTQDKRLFMMKDFKNSKFRILVSTDVAARGIHIDDIELVINYDVPRDKENYVHRIGRTGRKDKYGKSITLVNDKDEKYLNEIEEYIGYKINELKDINIIDETYYKETFDKYQKSLNKEVKEKSTEKKKIHNDITRFYLNAGKKKKLRLVDIVGAINNIEGINNEDIGIIEVQDLCSYVDILNNKGKIISSKYKEINIKRKLVKIKIDNKK